MKAADQTISVTRFIDFVVKTGSPKLTSVKNTKQQLIDGYSPATDYYKAIREEIVAMHTDGDPVTRLDTLVQVTQDESKRQNFAICANGYRKFYGPSRKYGWFEPPSADWDHGRITIRVNPEVGLLIKGVPHVIKLHLKDDRPSKRELGTVLHLMRTAFETESPDNIYAVLDVRRGKLFCESTYEPQLTFLLRGEADSFATIFDSV